ncbi:MAG TPA: alpha/beta hydrolase-fold protein [Trebonia sp.]|nr:alpha/beta hydrolase-fold protein [Trebonia sp.]
MLEPQGTAFLVLLILAFAGLVTWLALTKQVVLRVLSAFLAFIPAAVFGIAVVNKYYDYYQTWGALYGDLSGAGTQSVPQFATPDGASAAGSFSAAVATANTALSAQIGYVFRTTVTGQLSHLSRTAFVYLPPQYFQPAYKDYRFPAIELLNGSPGQPASWINVMDVIPIYLRLLAGGHATPSVLVMPDTDGGQEYSLQCLNIPNGPQDMTFVGSEVPDWVSHNLRVMPPGRAWGIAGYSEGGYCAANIGLQDDYRFGYVGSLSGYFAPSTSQIPAGGRPGGAPVFIPDIFAKDPKLAALNTPYKYIEQVPPGDPVPAFWLAAGGEDRIYLSASRVFRQYAMTRLSEVPLLVIPGGGHQAAVWRTALGPMLEWMTPRLTSAARGVEMIAVHARMPAHHLARRHVTKSSLDITERHRSGPQPARITSGMA